MSRQQKELCLQDKIKVINCSLNKSQRQLAEQFGVGKTQIQQILKRKAEYTQAFEENEGSQRKRLCVRVDCDKLDKLMFEWFCKCRSMNIPLSGPMVLVIFLIYAIV